MGELGPPWGLGQPTVGAAQKRTEGWPQPNRQRCRSHEGGAMEQEESKPEASKQVEFTNKTVSGTQPVEGRIVTLVDGHERSAGLQLRVFPSGEKRWVIRYRNRNGRQRRLTLGDAVNIPLGGEGGARDLARQARQKIAAGRDPAEEKKEHREADTVGEFADLYMERHAKAKKRSWKNDQALLDADILPKWKHRAMKEISKRDVRELLEGIVDRG